MQLSSVYKILGFVLVKGKQLRQGTCGRKLLLHIAIGVGVDTAAGQEGKLRALTSELGGLFIQLYFVFINVYLIYIVCIILMVFISFHKSSSKRRARTPLLALQRRTMIWRTLSKIPDLFRIISHAARILDTTSSSACTYRYEGDVCVHVFHISNYPPLLTHS
jgi:hypothetical protein